MISGHLDGSGSTLSQINLHIPALQMIINATAREIKHITRQIHTISILSVAIPFINDVTSFLALFI